MRSLLWSALLQLLPFALHADWSLVSLWDCEYAFRLPLTAYLAETVSLAGRPLSLASQRQLLLVSSSPSPTLSRRNVGLSAAAQLPGFCFCIPVVRGQVMV
jgi:hypothetical protein